MHEELDEVRQKFLSSEFDEDEIAENLQTIQSWEESLRANENFAGWQDHDISREIVKMFTKAYKENAIKLASDRNLSEDARKALWNRQDSIAWMLTIFNRNAKAVLGETLKQIRSALRHD